MDALQIQVAAASCVALFQARLAEQLSDSASAPSDEEQNCLETQSARFKLWADNIGAFAEGHASLDYRLHEHEEFAVMIRDQLSAIQTHLKRLSGFHYDQEGHNQLLAAERRYEGDEEGDDTDASLSSISSFTSGTSGSQTTQDNQYEPPPLVSVMAAVHRLHRVSMAIRQGSVETQNVKATGERFINEDGIDIVEAFKEFSLTILSCRHRSASVDLLQRLSQANAVRRRRFLYRQKHQQKLKGRRESAANQPTKSTAPTKTQISTFTTLKIGGSTPSARMRTANSSKKGGSARLTATTASVFAAENFKYEPSVPGTLLSVAASTQINLDPSLFPPAPKIPAGSAEFYCPYCCLIQPAAERSGRRWKQHFLKDLEPFVCLVENCSQPYQSFHDKTHWIEHMESHNRQFSCMLGGHRPEFFLNEADFDHHIEEIHGRFSATQRIQIKQRNSRAIPLSISHCPLCDFTPKNGGLTELINHIANELQQIALLSLAESDEVENDIPSDQSDLRIAEESTQADSDTGSLTFGLLMRDGIDDWLNEDAPPVSIEFEELQQPPPGLDSRDEWAFMHSRRPDYAGHEMDMKLDTFVRRVHLEKLLDEGKAADPILPCHFLPIRRNKDFFGRQGLLERLEKFLHPSTAQRGMASSITLSGPAGIGKTQAAVEFCCNLENQFDAIFWVHADEESKLANDFSRIAIRLGFVAENTAESRDHIHTRSVVKAWLSNPLKSLSDPAKAERCNWLLVFDHVINPKTIYDYWPSGCTSGAILITSRKPMPWGDAKYPTIGVEPFNTDESAAFLGLLTRTDRNKQEHSITLGRQAHHSPNQLTFLAKMIIGGRYSLEKFVKASKEEEGQQAILKLHAEISTLNKTDFAEWALEILEKGSGLLDVLSMLDPDCIPERMLTYPPSNIAIPDYPMASEDYAEARAELIRYSFLEKAGTNAALSIQRAVQDAARRRMSESYYRDVFNTCVKLINEAWPYQPFTWRHSINRWSKCEELFPHIVRLRQFAVKIPTKSDDMEGAYEYARLATDCGWYCHERGISHESEEFCDIAQNVCEKLKGYLEVDGVQNKLVTVDNVDSVLAEIHHNRGCIAAEMNRPHVTRKHQSMFNEMMIKEIGNKHPGTDMRLAISFNQLGVAHMINDDWIKGEECFRRCILEMERLDDYENFKISLPLVNWGSICWLTGRYDEAEERLLEGLADRMAKFGKNDRESFITGRFYHGLGNVKLAQGLHDDSFNYYEKARKHYRVTLGRQHHRSADVAVSIGIHHARHGEDDKALESFDIALNVYGDRSIYAPEKTRALFKRNQVLRRMGRNREADEDAEECLKLYRQIVPHDQRGLEELADGDIDIHIVFWSR